MKIHQLRHMTDTIQVNQESTRNEISITNYCSSSTKNISSVIVNISNHHKIFQRIYHIQKPYSVSI